MFCPNCGNAGQQPDTYCRSCGEYLFDPAGGSYFLSRIFGRVTPATQININISISILTVFACFFLVGFLNGHYDAQYAKTGEHPPTVVYWVYAFLALISAWQIFSLVVAVRLRNKLGRKKEIDGVEENAREFTIAAAETQELLPSPDYSVDVPSVTEEPTKILDAVTRTKT